MTSRFPGVLKCAVRTTSLLACDNGRNDSAIFCFYNIGRLAGMLLEGLDIVIIIHQTPKEDCDASCAGSIYRIEGLFVVLEIF